MIYQRQQIAALNMKRAAIRELSSALEAVRIAAQTVLEINVHVARVLKSRYPERSPRTLAFDISQRIKDLQVVHRRIREALGRSRGIAAPAPRSKVTSQTPQTPHEEEFIYAPDTLQAVAKEIYRFVISKIRGQIQVRNKDPFGAQFGIKIQPLQTFEGIPIYRISSNLIGFAAHFRMYIQQFKEMIAKAIDKKSAEIEVAVIDL